MTEILKSVGLIGFLIPGLDGAPREESTLSISELLRNSHKRSLSEDFEISRKKSTFSELEKIGCALDTWIELFVMSKHIKGIEKRRVRFFKARPP